MFTPGFKFFFGVSMSLVTAAIVFGYSTGGDHVGPLVWGWKGGIGDHVGYIVLMGLGVVAGTIGLGLVMFRDADPAAQAHYLGVESVVPTSPVPGSIWPVICTLGAGEVLVGLVLEPRASFLGLFVCVVAAAMWTLDASADQATPAGASEQTD